MPIVFMAVELVQIASAESNHFAGTPFRLVVAAITVRVPLTTGATCVPREVMLPSILTQLLRTGIMDTGGTDIVGEHVGVAEGGDIVGEHVGVAEGTVVTVLANAPAKFRPITAITVKRIAAIIVFILIISSF